MMMMMMMIIIITIIIIVIMIIIIIAFKCAIPDISQSPQCAANRFQEYSQVARAQSCASHVQHNYKALIT